MSSSKQKALISRRYEPSPDHCIRALELLLKSSGSKEGGSAITAPDDTRGDSKRVSRTETIIPK
jgi:hypothetical protein